MDLVRVVITEPHPLKMTVDCLKDILVDANLDFIRNMKQPADAKSSKKKAASVTDSESDEDSQADSESDDSSSDSESDSDEEDERDSKRRAKMSKAERAKAAMAKLKKLTKKFDKVALENKNKSNGMIRMLEINSPRSVMVYMKLLGASFNQFLCVPENISIGINFPNFHKLLKPVDKDDVLTLILRSDQTDKLIIRVSSKKNGGKTSEYSLTLIDVNKSQLHYDQATFVSMLAMPSDELQSVCKNMHAISDFVEIKSVGKEITFFCKGDIGTMKEMYGKNGPGKEKSKAVVQGIYELKHLVSIVKASPLCEEVEIYMKDKWPAVFKYAISGFGDLCFWVSPVSVKPQQNVDDLEADLSDLSGDDDSDAEELEQAPAKKAPPKKTSQAVQKKPARVSRS
jgi:proliferating cell nuclear antigen PCNA